MQQRCSCWLDCQDQKRTRSVRVSSLGRYLSWPSAYDKAWSNFRLRTKPPSSTVIVNQQIFAFDFVNQGRLLILERLSVHGEILESRPLTTACKANITLEWLAYYQGNCYLGTTHSIKSTQWLFARHVASTTNPTWPFLFMSSRVVLAW